MIFWNRLPEISVGVDTCHPWRRSQNILLTKRGGCFNESFFKKIFWESIFPLALDYKCRQQLYNHADIQDEQLMNKALQLSSPCSILQHAKSQVNREYLIFHSIRLSSTIALKQSSFFPLKSKPISKVVDGHMPSACSLQIYIMYTGQGSSRTHFVCMI